MASFTNFIWGKALKRCLRLRCLRLSCLRLRCLRLRSGSVRLRCLRLRSGSGIKSSGM